MHHSSSPVWDGASIIGNGGQAVEEETLRDESRRRVGSYSTSGALVHRTWGRNEMIDLKGRTNSISSVPRPSRSWEGSHITRDDELFLQDLFFCKEEHLHCWRPPPSLFVCLPLQTVPSVFDHSFSLCWLLPTGDWQTTEPMFKRESCAGGPRGKKNHNHHESDISTTGKMNNNLEWKCNRGQKKIRFQDFAFVRTKDIWQLDSCCSFAVSNCQISP